MPDKVLDVYPDILCLKCRNLDDGSYEHPACPAFPDGIPSNIILGGAAHFKMARGQEGDTVFAPKPGLEWVLRSSESEEEYRARVARDQK
jgi:hypothetical protein